MKKHPILLAAIFVFTSCVGQVTPKDALNSSGITKSSSTLTDDERENSGRDPAGEVKEVPVQAVKPGVVAAPVLVVRPSPSPIVVAPVVVAPVVRPPTTVTPPAELPKLPTGPLTPLPPGTIPPRPPINFPPILPIRPIVITRPGDGGIKLPDFHFPVVNPPTTPIIIGPIIRPINPPVVPPTDPPQPPDDPKDPPTDPEEPEDPKDPPTDPEEPEDPKDPPTDPEDPKEEEPEEPEVPTNPILVEDPLVAFAWHLKNLGQKSFAENGGVEGQDMKVQEVHALGILGAGVRIAVSDTGVDHTHPDLEHNELPLDHRNYALPGSTQWHGASPYPQEGSAHGTAVTGLASAVGWNKIGSKGIAPSAKFAGFYFLGGFHDSDSSYLAKAMDQTYGNFDIFNYSYGFNACKFYPVSDSLIAAYKAGVTNLRDGLGAVYVKAAGNEYVGSHSKCYTGDGANFLGNTNANEDQNHPYLILTAASNAKGEISSYSTPGSGIWITATGGEYGTKDPGMITTDLQGCTKGFSTSSASGEFNSGKSEFNKNCDYTSTMNGTSSSTPSISGIVALMLDVNANLSWRDVKHILAKTAEPIKYSTGEVYPPGNNTSGLNGHAYDYHYVKNAAGFDFSNTYGFGRVNALAAVKMAQNYVSSLNEYVETADPNSGAWYYESGDVNLSIPDHSAAGVTNAIKVSHNLKVESVQIRVTINHSYMGDVGLELISPSGTVSKLLLINSNLKDSGVDDFTFISNAFYGENSTGDWKIKLIDGASEDTGKLKSWKIKINGGKPSNNPAAAPQAVSGIVIPETSSSYKKTPKVSFSPSPSADVARYEVSVGTSPGGQQVSKWFSIGKNTNFQVEELSLKLDKKYYINIRTINHSESVSSEVNTSWKVQN